MWKPQLTAATWLTIGSAGSLSLSTAILSATQAPEIDAVRRRRGQLRDRRQKSAVPTVALVGYTNAGKTTLFNLLTGGEAVASDALFVTLDPLVRKVKLPDRRELLVSDTVGFISDLPTMLVAAFRATLEDVVEADVLLHVRDVSHGETEAQAGDVAIVLREGRPSGTINGLQQDLHDVFAD